MNMLSSSSKRVSSVSLCLSPSLSVCGFHALSPSHGSISFYFALTISFLHPSMYIIVLAFTFLFPTVPFFIDKFLLVCIFAVSNMNSVHAAENWRQRLVAEHASAEQWRDQWGFLEHKKAGISVDRQIPNRMMTRMVAEQGITYPYLQKVHRERRDGSMSPNATSNLASTTRASPYSNSREFTQALQQQAAEQQEREQQQLQQHFQQNHERQQPRTTTRRRQLGDPVPSAAPSRTQRSTRRQTQRSNRSELDQQQQQYGGGSPVQLAPLQHTPSLPSAAAATAVSDSHYHQQQQQQQRRPTTPILHLDEDQARAIRSHMQQEIGGCVRIDGLDPHAKYRVPLTTSQNIGWNIKNTTLEFFGTKNHSTRGLTHRQFYR
jgi:hypothetical protein